MQTKAFVLAAFLLTAVSCDRHSNEGPAEQAGKALDKAVDKAAVAIENATEDVRERVNASPTPVTTVVAPR